MANEKRLDLIDRNELLPNGVFYVNGENPMASLDELLNRIANAKSVDAVEVVHGRWIDNIDEHGFLRNAWRKCSACGGLNYSKRPPYCPHCGAMMDLEDEADA